MLDIKEIRDRIEEVKENIKNRNLNLNLNELLKLDDDRKKIQQEFDQLQAQKKNIKSREEGIKIKEQSKKIEIEFKSVKEKFYALMEQVPNFTHPDSPLGKTDEDNKETEQIGVIPKFDFDPKDHVELGKALNILDFEAGAKVAGQKFYYLKNQAVMLEIALISFAMQLLQQKGYQPIITPDLAKKSVLKGSGFNPRDDSDQIYNIQDTDLSLIATAEITIGGYHQDEILLEKELPLKYVGLSHCFRKEAGSHGQESKGLYRVHQFSKIEMYAICTPEESDKIHQELLEIEKEIFTKLGIPFRVVDVCTGDLGGPAYRKYDLEAWMPMKKGYGEITSTSNCTNYQARRLNIKYKNLEGEKYFTHTLNGTAIAISRALIAILENNQQADGSVKVPEVLWPYTGFKSLDSV